MENIESIMTMGIIAIVAFIILKFVFRLVMSVLIISLTMGLLYYDYNYNYLNNKESSYVVKYIDKHIIDIDGLKIKETVLKYQNDFDTLKAVRDSGN